MKDAEHHRNSDYVQLWQELCSYVGFGPEHADALQRLRPALEPHFVALVDTFYAAIEANPEARSVFSGGSAQIERQKGFLSQWLQEVFSGVYDEDYVMRHARIGRTHVRIGLSQRYMFGGMALLRDGLHRALASLPDPPVDVILAERAIHMICDLELAVMLETYSDHYITQIRSKERLATLGQIAGFVGHELRNPLAVMETSLHLLRRRVQSPDERTSRHLTRLTEQVSLCGDIVSGLLELTRDREPVREEVSLPDLVKKAVDGMPGHEQLALEIEIEDAAARPRVDPTHLRHLLTNLLSNAATALREQGKDGRVWVRAQREQQALVICVEDEGPGLDATVLTEVFEPLHTTRAKGLGLGLALCRKIAEKHGGSIRAENRTEGGARFVVRLSLAFEEGR